MVLPASETVTGTVERITFYNPENGFSVVKLRIRGRRDPVSVVGTLPACQPGEILVLVGQWHIDARHGAQFQPTNAVISQPTDAEGIIRYLGSGLIRLIGPVLARRIVSVFGERTLEVLDATPDRVREVPGIGRRRAEAIGAAWVEHRALRGIVAFLGAHGLDTRYAPRLLKAYGAEAPRILAANPYRLVAEVPGLGFAAADHLGQDIGVRPTSPARLQGAVHAALLRAAEQGHTRLRRADLVAGAASSAGADPALIEAAIGQHLAAGTLSLGSAVTAAAPETGPPVATAVRGSTVRVFEPPTSTLPLTDDSPIGLGGLVRAEEDLVARLLGLARRPGLPEAEVNRWLAADPGAHDLSEEQRIAVRDAALAGCFVLTGGPGVGKTTTTRVLTRCLVDLGASVALAAPTGKAAKRLGEVVGMPARTLHRLLGAVPKGFQHGPRDPLPFDVVIVDETSMLDTSLARALARAIGPRGRLILVGDADQLPSVGPGQVLRDLLSAERVPSARLTTVFRQAARSRIVTNAHRIRQGLLPEFDPPPALSAGADCIFVPASAAQVAAVGARWAGDLLPRALGVPATEVQALAPLTRVCQALNSTLQERLNPPRGQAEAAHGALSLRVGDRVIQTRNNYDLGVFNGDTGLLVEVRGETLTVDFGDQRRVEYPRMDAMDLEHAYCLTVHRAQGSEWAGVVLLASSSFGPMLSRSLLYTGLTRARRAVVVVGDAQAIARAVAEVRDQQRLTGLPGLLATRTE
ncbi:MAG TPA: ATP-dependent RecD-like DNA helicase [Chloroflexota bacterium]|nr:ATP-dependent RecD-like DNA helicase [Chloroflexota bacterium]